MTQLRELSNQKFFQELQKRVQENQVTSGQLTQFLKRDYANVWKDRCSGFTGFTNHQTKKIGKEIQPIVFCMGKSLLIFRSCRKFLLVQHHEFRLATNFFVKG